VILEQTVLLVGHGSRDEHGNQEIADFAANWRQLHPQWRIEVCFIEFAEVLLDQGFDNAARDSQKVIVVPLILNAAGHVKMQVPTHLAAARKRHPEVDFVFARHLGTTEMLMQVLRRNVMQTMVKLAMPDPKTTGVILLGRGSSDKVANGEVAKMARWLLEETDHELVDIAFTGITYPRIETVVQRQVKLGMTQIVIQPYYLYTGTLIKRIDQQVERLRQQYSHISFGLGNYLGFEKEIYQILDGKVEELSKPEQVNMMECDGCGYRKFAEEHGHGHHHH
jgi:sirohydrochlorin cobaltochelatase